MPFQASVSENQSQDGSVLTIADTSNYPIEGKGTFNGRQLYIYLADGSTLLADGSIVNTTPSTGINWAFSMGDTLTIPLQQDYALNIVLILTSNNPQSGSTYTAQLIPVIDNYLWNQLQSLTASTQAIAALQNSLDYNLNWLALYFQIKCIQNSQPYTLISSMQNAIDRANILVNNQYDFFGK